MDGEFDIEVKHGEVTGRELFRVRGVEMAWLPSRDEAVNVAKRIQKAIDGGMFAEKAEKRR